jgi:hypothetical protein
MGAGAGVPTFELVPELLVGNLDTVAARMGMGMFVDCARVSWSSNAFRTVSALTSGLVLSSANGHNLVMTLTFAKVHCELGKEVEDTLKEGAGLHIPVFRNIFFGPKKPFLPGFLRIFFPCVFRRNFSQERGFGGGCRNSCFLPLSQEFFAGIPV